MFKTSATENQGYFVGRYEARTTVSRGSNNVALTEVNVKPNDFVYNYITQIDAAEQSKSMYNKDINNFTSDLINSYAWDTTILFLQEFDNRTSKPKPYSWQTSLNNNFAIKGTNNFTNTSQHDKICNIWDMASNNYEWTTETATISSPCVLRGGLYNMSDHYTSYRYSITKNSALTSYTFRPIIYIKN